MTWPVCIWIQTIFNYFSPPLPSMNLTDFGFEPNPFLRLTWDMFADRIMNDESVVQLLHRSFTEYGSVHF
ncbi:hypothetical protein HMI55_001552 [Coelomomyces lativittatus]|nr:hypothetical protein HMI55_001552 [Coelomomyces lativittatus]